MYTSTIPEVRDFQRYMNVRRNCAPKTAEGYARYLDRFALFIAPRPLLKAKAKHITAWTDGLMEDGSNQPQSIHRKLAAISGFFRWGRKTKLTKKNPMEDVEKPSCGKPLPEYMTEAEVETVMRVAENRTVEPFFKTRDLAALQVMYGSGLRRSEVAQLDLADLDLDLRTLHVRHGKGDKARLGFLSPEAVVAVKAWLERRPTNATALFTKTNGKRLSARQLWVVFREIADAAGLKKRVVPHTLRHSYATHLRDHGADIQVVQRLLGHSSVATTERYSHVSLEHLRSAYEGAFPQERAS